MITKAGILNIAVDLADPSTYAGIAGLASVFGLHYSIPTFNIWAQGLMGLASLAAMVLSKNKPAEVPAPPVVTVAPVPAPVRVPAVPAAIAAPTDQPPQA